MDLHKLNAGGRIVFVPFQGEKLAVEYDVKGYEATLYTEVVRINKLPDGDPERMRVNSQVIDKMVTAWDLTEGCTEECAAHKANGSGPICRQHAAPVNAEMIEQVPYLLKDRIVARIMADINEDGSDPKPNGTV